MLLLRFTTFVNMEAYTFCESIWDMYYGSSLNFNQIPTIYAIPKKSKILVDDYVLNKFAYSSNMTHDLFDINDLFYGITFFYDAEENTYINSAELDGVFLKFVGTKLFQQFEDNDGNIFYGEEWILLQGMKINK